MSITSVTSALPTNERASSESLRQVFGEFVGELFYGQMLSVMRSSQEKPAYFHGGRAEEVFQGQLDQMLGQEMAQANGASFSEALYQQQFVNHWR